MESLFIYLLKASGILFFFLLTFLLLLRKDTLFQSHRWFFQLGLITSVLLPLFYISRTIIVSKTNVVSNISSVSRISNPIKQNFTNLDWLLLLTVIYLVIVSFFVARFILALLSVRKVISKYKIKEINGQKVCNIEEAIAPFSFFSKIVLNPSQFSVTELEAILEHEAAHCKGKHTVDILLMEFYCAIFWWNPFAWFYKKQLLLNLEYIADQRATQQIEDKKAYQFLLLKSINTNSLPTVANSFFQSPLKNRIVMMNTKPTKKSKAWKYMLILPAVFLFVGIFQIRYLAQETKNSSTEVEKSPAFNSANIEEPGKPQPPSNNYLDGMPEPPKPPSIHPPEPPKIHPPKNPNYEAGWAKYEAIMDDYEKLLAEYELKMEPYFKALDEYEKQMEPYYKKMDEFEVKFEAYEKELDTYYKKFDSEFDKQLVEYEKAKKAKK